MKKDGQYEMKHAGNFNYGTTGTALGIPEWILERAPDCNKNKEIHMIRPMVIGGE